MKTKKSTENSFSLLFEYGLAAEIDPEKMGFKDRAAPMDFISEFKTDASELAKKLELCNGFRYFVNNLGPDKIKQGMKGGFHSAIIDIWGTTHLVSSGSIRGKKIREHTDILIDYCRELVKKHGDKIRVNAYPEFDNAQWQRYAGKLENRAQAYQRLRELYEGNHDMAMYPPQDDNDFPFPPKSCKNQIKAREKYFNQYLQHLKKKNKTPISVYTYLKERNISPDEINLINLCCQTYTPHLIYEMGGVAWPEGNVGNNHQITIAFTRGAARQYHKDWIYDIAPFDCQGPIPMAYNSRRQRIAGFTESYILRCWLISFLSGTSHLLFQTSSLGFFTRNKRDQLELTPIGETGRDFADFALRRHPERGKTRAPVALLLAKDHGYTLPYRNQPRLFNGQLPDDRENRSIEAFFRLAFPECSFSNGKGFDTSAWAADDSMENQAPWINKNIKTPADYQRSLREQMKNYNMDFRPREKAFLTTSTWGDSFDVLVDNAPLDVLKNYPAIILLGNITLDDTLRQRLDDYVKQGGKILICLSQVTKDDEKLLGLHFMEEMGIESCYSHSLTTNRLFCGGAYEFAKVELNGAVPILEAGFFGRTSSSMYQQDSLDLVKIKNKKNLKGLKGDFAATKNKYGKGEVWFVNIPDYQNKETMSIDLHEGCKEVFDHFICPHLALEIHGPQIEWLVNDTDNGIWVGLFNNSTEVWTGQILVNDKLGKVSCRDIWNEKYTPFEYDEFGKVVLKPEIAPWDFKIIEIKPQND